jgi:AcrR family transcriptional regulator
MSEAQPNGAAPRPKLPRTEKGRRTLRKLLDAAADEFGERGFHAGSISGITRRAGVALGTFYTYFDSKDAIFRELVKDLSSRVGEEARKAQADAPDALGLERAALEAFLRFAREHKVIYRIIDESEFVDPETFRLHYATTAARILKRLETGMKAGELRDDLGEADAWAIMGMNVFLGLRYAIWSEDRSPAEIAEVANTLLRQGIRRHGPAG